MGTASRVRVSSLEKSKEKEEQNQTKPKEVKKNKKNQAPEEEEHNSCKRKHLQEVLEVSRKWDEDEDEGERECEGNLSYCLFGWLAFYSLFLSLPWFPTTFGVHSLLNSLSFLILISFGRDVSENTGWVNLILFLWEDAPGSLLFLVFL